VRECVSLCVYIYICVCVSAYVCVCACPNSCNSLSEELVDEKLEEDLFWSISWRAGSKTV